MDRLMTMLMGKIKAGILGLGLWVAGTLSAGAFLHTSSGHAVMTLDRVVTSYSGLVMDFLGNDFRYQPAGGGAPTIWADFPTMFTALSGSMTSSAKTCYNSSGIMVTIPVNTAAQPCFDGTGRAKGWILEQAVIQSLTNPSLYTGADWTKTGTTLSSHTVTSPNGTADANALTESAGAGNHWIIQSNAKAASALAYVASCHFQPSVGDRDFLIQIDDGAGNGIYVTSPADGSTAPVVNVLGTGWGAATAFFEQAGSPPSGVGTPFWRLAVAVTSNSAATIRVACGMANNGNPSYTGDGTSKISVWGANLAQNSIGANQTAVAPTSYITSATTRVLDQAIMNLPVGLQGATAYSEFLTVSLPKAPNSFIATFTSIADSTEAQKIAIYQNKPDTGANLSTQAVGTTTTTLTLSGPSNVYGQDVSITTAGQGTAYSMMSSFQAKHSVIIMTFPTLTMSKVRFGGSTTGATLSSDIAIQQMGIFPAKIPDSIFSALLFPGPRYNPDAIFLPNYFTQPMINDVLPTGTPVWRSAPMPASDSTTNVTYLQYPLSIAYNQNILGSNTSTATLTKFAWLQWGNRCDLCASNTFNNKPNSYGIGIFIAAGVNTQTSFTTLAKADAATYAQTLYSTGYPMHAGGACPAGQTWCGYADAANAAGIPDSDIIPYATAQASPGTYFTFTYSASIKTSHDLIILPADKFSSGVEAIYGILCDCEMTDGRLASQTLVLMQQLTLMVHNAPTTGLKFAVVTDTLTGAGQTGGFCGVGATQPNCDVQNMTTIINTIDEFLFQVTSPPVKGYTFASQIDQFWAMMGSPGSFPAAHVTIQFALGLWPGGTSILDAQTARAFFLAKGLGGISLSPLFNVPGGTQCRFTNIKIEIMLGLDTDGCL